MLALLHNPIMLSLQFSFRNIRTGTLRIVNGQQAVDAWPWMREHLENWRSSSVSYVGNISNVSYGMSFQKTTFVVAQPGDVMPSMSDLPVTLTIPAIKQINKRFRHRQRQGEIIMSDYRVGTMEYRRRMKLVGSPTSAWPTSWPAFNHGYFHVVKNGVRVIESPYEPILVLPTPGENEVLESCIHYSTLTWMPMPVSSLVGSPDLSVLDLSKLAVEKDTALVTKVLSDCNDGVYDLLTEALELPQTLQFLASEFSKAVNMTCDLEDEARKARKTMSAAKFTKWFADHWLKGRYALMPIFYSIQDIRAVLDQMGREYAEYKDGGYLPTAFPVPLPSNFKCSDTPEVRHRCMIKSQYTVDSLLADFRRLININLAATAWEMTTLSFVADWAFNIGDFITALTGSDGAADTMSCYAVRHVESYEVGYNSLDPKLAGVTTSVRFNFYDRTVINPLDHIGLSYGSGMNMLRIIDAFALSINPSLARLRVISRGA